MSDNRQETGNMYKNFKKLPSLVSDSRGFTFLELLVTMALIVGISVVLTQVFFTTTRSTTKTEVFKEVKQSGDFAMQTMERMIRSASSVTSTCSDSGSTMTSLTIVNPDNDVTTFTCALDGSIAKIASVSAAETFYLTSDSVTVGGSSCSTSTLSFICTKVSNEASKVRIEYTLSQKNSSGDQFEKATSTFQSTVTLRQ